MIRARDLTAGHRGIAAVRGVDLEVNEGELVGLFGANGAGKTTTLMTLAGLLPPISGEIELFGTRVTGARSHRHAKDGLAVVPEGRGVFHQLTVAENLRIHHLRSSQVTVDDVLDRFPELRPLLRRRAGLLSGGEQQMLAIGSALIADPRMLLIDELSLGLAPLVVERLLTVVAEIVKSSHIGVLLVEQHVHAALTITDRAYVLANGDVTFSGPSSELQHDNAVLMNSYLGTADATANGKG